MGSLDSTNLVEPVSRRDASVPHRSGSKNRWWLWTLIVAVLLAAGVWYFRDSANRSETHAQGTGTPPAGKAGGQGRGGAGAFAVPVVVATARVGDLPVYFNGLGTVTAFNTVTVRSRVDGQITKINFQEGQYVHQGDALAEIDSRPFQVQLEQAEGQLARDQAQLRDIQLNFDRSQLLFKEGVIPRQQVDSQQAQVSQYQGVIKADQAQIDNAKLQIAYSHITAPISGRVGLRLVDMGNMVRANDPNGLIVITQLQPIAVLFSLPQDQLPEVNGRIRAGAQLAVEAYDRDDTSKIATGKLLTIDNQIDTTTGTYKLKGVFGNENGLLFPNQFVNVHLLVDTKRNLTIVPTAAVLRGSQGAYVYALNSDKTVKIQPVSIAQTNGNSIGLGAGLKSGDTVVIDGQDKLQDGSRVIPTPAPAAPGGASASGTDAQPAAPRSRRPDAQPAKESGGTLR
jgi:multidrug efflux system membrane fusion protein